MSESDDCATNADQRRRENNMVRKVAIPRRSTGGCREHPESEIVCPSEDDDSGDLSSEPGENAEQECDSELEELATRTLFELKAEKEGRNSSALVGYVDRGPTDMVVDNSSGPIDGDRTNDIQNRGGNYKTKDSYKTNRMKLSSSLQSDFDVGNLYVNTDPYKHPSLRNKSVEDMLLRSSTSDELMKKSVLTAGTEKKDALPPYEESLNQLRKQKQRERAKTKGRGWFDMSAPEMTEEKKNDLLVLQMRKTLDPKQFYKAPDIKAFPKYFQMGTVVETAADFYHSRIPKKQRKATLVDELLADAKFRQYNKQKYTELVQSKQRVRGAHRHMKRLKKHKK